MKRFSIMLCIGLLTTAVGCEKAPPPSSDNLDVDSDVDCGDGQTRCSDNNVQHCSDGEWTLYEECVIQELVCSVIAGEATCYSPDSEDDSDSESDSESNLAALDRLAYIWIANSIEGTVSKVDTKAAVEVARYRTCPNIEENSYCDPSRLSVNRHGDMVVTNRYPNPNVTTIDTPHASSATKIIADKSECIDRNGNGRFDTSTGPNDVMAWGSDGPEDECIAWHTPLSNADGSRATSWDGTTDPETGLGGNVLIGTCKTKETTNPNGDPIWEHLPSMSKDDNVMYILDGETGAIVETVHMPDGEQTECFYGGAMGNAGWFWVMEGFGFPISLKGINTNNTSEVSSSPLTCGYSITVDTFGRVWTAGKGKNVEQRYGQDSCVQRIDPNGNSDSPNIVSEALMDIELRGLAVGSGISENFVWAAETSGLLYKIDIATAEVLDSYRIRGIDGYLDQNGMIGVAIDSEGYIWTVSAPDNACYKFNPQTEEITKVDVGTYPYTYSDLTGMQLFAVQ